MDDEEELIAAGGDPTFLDDSLWSSPASAVASGSGSLGSSGEDPELQEEDELMMAGGDPAFLDDSQWAGSPAESAALSSFSGLGSSGEDPEMDEETELLMSGGDPSFLDDRAWQATAPAAESDEWDGREDDSAHFDG